ncbi:MAG: hypothetical protein KKI08_17750 [Armatimonadetes bacterium]|nr:hypothetical protein [Armatimonadota bacterium]
MRRNIYIRDEDEPLFEEAEKMAGDEGSLSGVIAAALRGWIGRKQAEDEGYELTTVETFSEASGVGFPAYKFMGRLLAAGKTGEPYMVKERLYKTRAGKLVFVQEGWSEDWQRLRSLTLGQYDAIEEVPFCSSDARRAACEALGQDPANWIE